MSEVIVLDREKLKVFEGLKKIADKKVMLYNMRLVKCSKKRINNIVLKKLQDALRVQNFCIRMMCNELPQNFGL